MTVWKFPLVVIDEQFVEMPEVNQPLSVQVQSGTPCLWSLVDPESRRIKVSVDEPWRVELECECDGDCQDGRMVKISRYCPMHDDCESCGERLGVMQDPTFNKAVEKRAAWLCAQCAKETVES